MPKCVPLLGLILCNLALVSCSTNNSNINAATAASYEEAGSIVGQHTSSDMQDVDANPNN